MMNSSFHIDGCQYWLGPHAALHDAGMPAADALTQLHPWQATALVERAFRGAAAMPGLRSVVGAQRYGMAQWPDHEVRAEAARLLASGAWVVWRREQPVVLSAAAAAIAAGTVASPPPAPRAQQTAVPARTPARTPVRPPAAAVPAEPVEAEWTAALRQDAYAAALEEAALAQLPFCEICT